MDMSARIKTALLSKFRHKDGKINYSAAAKAIGVSRQAVMHWINQSPNEIKISSLIKLSEVTGHSQHWLISGDEGNEYHGVAEPIEPYLVTHNNAEEILLDHFRKLSRNQRDAICLVMKSMTSEHFDNNAQ